MLPVEGGLDPGTGSIVAALEYASGRKAEIVGKPAPGMMLEALRAMGAEASQTLVVGDGLELDIVAGTPGINTALVLTGMSTRAQAEAATGPSNQISPSMASAICWRRYKRKRKSRYRSVHEWEALGQLPPS